MKRVVAFGLVLLAGCSIGAQQRSSGGEPPTREILNAVLLDYEEARKAGDLERVRVSLSSASYTAMRNHSLSIKRDFGENLQLVPGENLTFRGMSHRGDTAVLIELEKSHVKPDDFLLHRRDFVREQGRWRFHSWSFGPLPAAEAMRLLDADQRDFEAQFPPLHEVPTPPAHVLSPPDYRAKLSITCFEYRATLILNGYKLEAFEDTSSGGPLIGGLRRGTNQLELRLERLESARKGPSHALVEVGIEARHDDGRKTSVFEYSPENPPAMHRATFEVNDTSFDSP